MSIVFSFSEGLARKASRCLEQGSYQTAARLYHRITQINPGSISAMFGRAFAYHEMEDLGKAIWSYQQVLKKDAENPGAYNNLANCYLGKNCTKAAIKNYIKAIEIQVQKKISQSTAILNLIELYRDLEQTNRALIVADYWLKAFPYSPEVIRLRHHILAKLQIRTIASANPFQSSKN